MAISIGELLASVGIDTSGFDRGVNGLQVKLLGIKDSTLKWQDALKVVAGATGLALAAKATFDLGAAVEETSSKFRTVFGPAQESVQAFIDDFASMAGLTETNAQSILATTGSIVQGMGYSQEASAKLAQEVVRLAGDFSSFNNIPIEETSRAIQAALTGEREQLKRLGIIVQETAVQQRAMEMSGKANATALTQQEKAAATMAIITEKAGVAVGDLERTQNSSANTARRVTAEILNFRDSLAVAAMPAINVFLGAIGDVVGTGGLAGIGNELQRQAPVIAAWANVAVRAMEFVARAIAGPLQIAFNLGQVIGGLLRAAFQAQTLNFSGARETLKGVVGDFGDMKGAVAGVVSSFDGLREAAGTAFQTLATTSVQTISTTQSYTAQLEGAADAAGDLAREHEAARMAAERSTVFQQQLNGMVTRTTASFRIAEDATAALTGSMAGVLMPAVTAQAKDFSALSRVLNKPVSEAVHRFMEDVNASAQWVKEYAADLGVQFTSLGLIGKEAMNMVAGAGLDVLSSFTPLGLLSDVLSGAFEALKPFLDALKAPLQILGIAIGKGLAPILKALFPVIKFLTIAASYLAQGLFLGARNILFVFGWLVKGLGKLIDALPFVSGKGIIAAGDKLLETSKEMGAAAAGMGDVRDEIRALEWPEEAESAAQEQKDATERVATVVEVTTEAVREVGSQLVELATGMVDRLSTLLKIESTSMGYLASMVGGFGGAPAMAVAGVDAAARGDVVVQMSPGSVVINASGPNAVQAGRDAAHAFTEELSRSISRTSRLRDGTHEVF